MATTVVPRIAGAVAYDPTNVAITGGSISGVSGAPIILMAGGLPFISLSSGSVAANGAISAITALPRVYPAAYCWFPANALATSIVAGWYYCTFATTTTGTAFLNTYTSGKPTIPASPAAVVDGKGAFTGVIVEVFGPTLTLPVISATGSIRVAISGEATNNANAKSLSVRASGSGGTAFLIENMTSVATAGIVGAITNTDAAKQISQTLSAFGANPSTANALGTQDFTTGTATVVVSLTKGTATDNLVLLPPVIEVVQ